MAIDNEACFTNLQAIIVQAASDIDNRPQPVGVDAAVVYVALLQVASSLYAVAAALKPADVRIKTNVDV